MQHKCRAKARRPSAEVLFSPARCMKFRSGQSVNTLHSSLYASQICKSRGAQGNNSAAAALPMHMAAGRDGCTALHGTALSGLEILLLGIGVAALCLSSSSDSLARHPARGAERVVFFANAASRLRDIRPAFLQASCRAKSHAGPTRTSCCSSFEQSKAAATLASPPSHSRTAAASTTLSSHLACLACLRVALSHLDHHRRNLRASRVLSDSPPSTFSPAILCLALYHIDTISPSHPPPHPRPTDQMSASTTT